MQGCGQSPGSARCCRSMNTKNRSNGGYTSTRCKSTRQRRCSCPRSMAKTAKVTTVGSGRCEGPCLAETLYIYIIIYHSPAPFVLHPLPSAHCASIRGSCQEEMPSSELTKYLGGSCGDPMATMELPWKP